ncbi:MAG: hypothetical protein NPIRA03_38570 [Nitrospirales bacterium]|nr:MAG: hypothetical protein NPIRA03_38570 [Nitrospirales bacterium]
MPVPQCFAYSQNEAGWTGYGRKFMKRYPEPHEQMSRNLTENHKGENKFQSQVQMEWNIKGIG